MDWASEIEDFSNQRLRARSQSRVFHKVRSELGIFLWARCRNGQSELDAEQVSDSGSLNSEMGLGSTDEILQHDLDAVLDLTYSTIWMLYSISHKPES